eukprot:scaffold18239_cov112-Isochrysis_galbana.AAC.4
MDGAAAVPHPAQQPLRTDVQWLRCGQPPRTAGRQCLAACAEPVLGAPALKGHDGGVEGAPDVLGANVAGESAHRAASEPVVQD